MKSFTVIVAEGEYYSSGIFSEEDLKNLTPTELGNEIRSLVSMRVDSQEPNTHISHARKFLEEQRDLHEQSDKK